MTQLADNQLKTLYGLVLAGGFSSRMGEDKSSLIYHHQPQRVYLYELLSKFCEKVFVSCREEQSLIWQDKLPYIFDEFIDVGPIAGVWSAFKQYPDVGWLVVACDLPFLDEATLQLLISQRNKSATVFLDGKTNFIEPLCSIWEASCKSILYQNIQEGNYSLAKILNKIDTNFISLKELNSLKNVNEWKEYKQIIGYSN